LANVCLGYFDLEAVDLLDAGRFCKVNGTDINIIYLYRNKIIIYFKKP